MIKMRVFLKGTNEKADLSYLKEWSCPLEMKMKEKEEPGLRRLSNLRCSTHYLPATEIGQPAYDVGTKGILAGS